MSDPERPNPGTPSSSAGGNKLWANIRGSMRWIGHEIMKGIVLTGLPTYDPIDGTHANSYHALAWQDNRRNNELSDANLARLLDSWAEGQK